MLDVAGQGRPVAPHVRDGLPERALRQHDLRLELVETPADLLEERPRLREPQQLALRLGECPPLRLDGVEALDGEQHEGGPRVGVPRPDEVAPRVRPAADLDDLPGRVERVVARVGVRLEEPAIPPEHPERSVPAPRRGEVVGDVALLPDVGPDEPAGRPLRGRQVGDRRVVGVDDAPREHLGEDRVRDGSQTLGDGGDDVAEGRAREVDAGAREDLLLAVDREVVGVLRDDDVGGEPRPDRALGEDRGRRPLGQDAALPARAGPHAPDGALDEEGGGHVLRALADLLADPGERLAAAGADALGLGRVEPDLLDGEARVRGLLRGRRAPGPGCRGRRLAERRLERVRLERLLLGLRGGLGLLEGEPELAGVELLRALAEHPLRERLDAVAQEVVLEQEARHAVAQLGDADTLGGELRAFGVELDLAIPQRRARRFELEKERVPRHGGGTLRHAGDGTKRSLAIYAVTSSGIRSMRRRQRAEARSSPSRSA